jgi:hypothetical protein
MHITIVCSCDYEAMEPSITNIQAARDNTSLLTQINKNGFTFFFSVYECMLYKTLELTDWHAQKVCPPKF